jgi:hypothetical protein
MNPAPCAYGDCRKPTESPPVRLRNANGIEATITICDECRAICRAAGKWKEC